MMPVILLIGRICSGKTTYAREIMAEKQPSVLLSGDELMRAIFPDPLGEQYDVYAARCRQYLYQQARQLAAQGVTPVLDWGFWSREDRREAMQALAGLELDWRYVDISPEEWRRRIEIRNGAVLDGQAGPETYFVDEGLLSKLESRFEEPDEIPGLIRV